SFNVLSYSFKATRYPFITLRQFLAQAASARLPLTTRGLDGILGRKGVAVIFLPFFASFSTIYVNTTDSILLPDLMPSYVTLKFVLALIISTAGSSTLFLKSLYTGYFPIKPVRSFIHSIVIGSVDITPLSFLFLFRFLYLYNHE